jgi:aminoglycoside/choline kinase family phosphotransferase
MNSKIEELEYEEKMDRISEYLEELIMDAMLAALEKIIKRNWQFADFSYHQKAHDMQF